MAGAYTSQGLDLEAEKVYRRVLHLVEMRTGPDDPEVASIVVDLALVLPDSERFVEREELWKRAIRITKKATGPEAPQMWWMLKDLAKVYAAQARYHDAEETLNQARLSTLLQNLISDGYSVFGPRLRDGAIAYGPLTKFEDLPIGWSATAAPGRYRIHKNGPGSVFGTGPPTQGLKQFMHPPEIRLFEHEQHVPPQPRPHVRDDAGRHVGVGIDPRPRHEPLRHRAELLRKNTHWNRRLQFSVFRFTSSLSHAQLWPRGSGPRPVDRDA